MDNLVIQATTTTPEIILLKEGKVAINGICIPDNITAFMSPVIDWINAFKATKPEKLDLDFKIEYLNTVTFRFIYELLILVNSFTENGTKVNYNWHHEKDDEDLKDLGEEFAEITNLKFNFITL